MKTSAKCLAVILALFALLSGCSLGERNSSLDAAIGRFIEAKNAQDYKSLWELTSDRFRRGNDGDVEAYAKYVSSQGFHSQQVSVLRTSIHGATASVVVKAVYVTDEGDPAGSAVERWQFIMEKGGWFFDDYNTISESAP